MSKIIDVRNAVIGFLKENIKTTIKKLLNKKVGDLVPHAAAALLVLFADRPFYVGPTCWMNLISSQTQISLQAPGTAKVSETELHGLLDDMLGVNLRCVLFDFLLRHRRLTP